MTSLSLFGRAHCFAVPCCWIPDCSKFQGSRLQAQPLTNTTVIYLRINTSVSMSYDCTQQSKRAGMRGMLRTAGAEAAQRCGRYRRPLAAQGLGQRENSNSEQSRSCQNQQHPQKSELGKPSTVNNYKTSIHAWGGGKESRLL